MSALLSMLLSGVLVLGNTRGQAQTAQGLDTAAGRGTPELTGSRPVAGAVQVLRITNGEWPPFTSERFAHYGVLSRIVAEAFALEGITVEYGFFPWRRAYLYTKEGLWEGSVGWAPTPEHQQDFYLSEPVIFVDKAFFHLKSTPFTWKTIDDVRAWRVGATAGYSYGAEWDRAVKAGRLQVEEVAYDEHNVRKLLAGRIDVFAMETEVAQHLIGTLLTPEQAALITYHPRLVMQTPICLALSRKLPDSPQWLAKFNRGLHRLKASGRYQHYLEESRRGQ